jgi:hypothetical protein
VDLDTTLVLRMARQLEEEVLQAHKREHAGVRAA